MSPAEMKSPVIVVCHGMWVERDLASLGRCNRLAWIRGDFEVARYFDAAGHAWRVSSTRPPRPSGRLPRWITHVYNPEMRVEVTFAPPTGYALSDLADVLCKVVDEDPDDLYDQWVSHEELKELFRSAVTFDRLTHLVETLGLEDDETTLAR